MRTGDGGGPLQGIKVLDLSRVLAGPFATQLLGDYGAEIIKIERPGAGDDTRGWGPPFSVSEDGVEKLSAYFQSANRNKKSVAIDIARPEGAEIVRDLARHCDILVENFKVGGLKKYGLDYQSVANINPRLIYCSITGFGQKGPLSDQPGYDFMIQAMGGLMSITGAPEGTPGAEPMKSGVAVADLFTGLYAANGILAALFEAQRSGQGQHLDIALLDCQMAMLANQGMNYLVSGKPPQRMGNAHPNIAPYQVFETADGHVVVAVGNDEQFARFCAEIELSSLPEDERFKTNPERVANRGVLIALLAPALKARATAYWLDAFKHAGVPCGPIRDIAEVFSDRHCAAREMMVTASAGAFKDQPTIGNPVKFSRTPVAYHIAPPPLGSSTCDVLEMLCGMDRKRLNSLRESRIIQGD